jgi:ketosteroid isomerase-like protein
MSNKYLAVALTLMCGSASFAQSNSAKVIAAEKQFAKYAIEHTTKDAFLIFLANDGIVFSNGKAINGKKQWTANKADSMQLKWYPSITGISAAGDMGYSTGPWEFRRSKTDKDAIAYGNFASIWQKQKNGQYKVKLDIGIDHSKDPVKLPEAGVSYTKATVKKVKQSFLAAEKQFIKAENNAGLKAYLNVLSPQLVLLRPDRLPFNYEEAVAYFTANSVKYCYKYDKGHSAVSNDLAYVYGNVTYTTDGKIHNGNYLRVWRAENGKWKIVMDVISI